MERKKGKQQRKEKKLSFFNLIEQRILYFERLDKKKTASNYICAFKHFKRFRGDQDIAIEDLTVGQMKDFQSYLIGEGLRMNTISLYNRELRAVYNYVCYNNRFATLAYWIFTLVGTGGPALWHRPFPDR